MKSDGNFTKSLQKLKYDNDHGINKSKFIKTIITNQQIRNAIKVLK